MFCYYCACFMKTDSYNDQKEKLKETKQNNDTQIWRYSLKGGKLEKTTSNQRSSEIRI